LRKYDDEEGLYRGLIELPVKRASDGAVVRFIELRDAVSLRTYARYLQNVDPAVLEPILGGRWMDRYDLSTVCASVRCPVLVFQASQKLGGMLTDDDLSTLQSGLTVCEVIKATESGHMIHATHGDQMVQALISFLGADAGI
jgi:pimeloyl-ACP methyl ester carboxylesterase